MKLHWAVVLASALYLAGCSPQKVVHEHVIKIEGQEPTEAEKAEWASRKRGNEWMRKSLEFKEAFNKEANAMGDPSMGGRLPDAYAALNAEFAKREASGTAYEYEAAARFQHDELAGKTLGQFLDKWAGEK